MPGREYDEAQQMINVDRAGQEWTDAARQSFQALADQTMRLQESNLRLTQNFFQQFAERLQGQTGQPAGHRDAAAAGRASAAGLRDARPGVGVRLLGLPEPGAVVLPKILRQATGVAQSNL